MSDGFRSRADEALSKLAAQFADIDWEYHEIDGRPGEAGTEEAFFWRTSADEDVAVCAFRGSKIYERFHRQSYFFFNYAYDGDYDALSADRHNRITVREGELYVSQPYAGYALRGNPERDITILGVLVRTETFLREFMPTLAVDAELLDFYLAPTRDSFADTFHLLHPEADSGIRELLELMAVEYAFPHANSQATLKALALALAQKSVRQLQVERPSSQGPVGVADSMAARIHALLGNVTLEGLAAEFGYHPNYVSAFLKEKTGRTFREHQLEARMDCARKLLGHTDMTIEEVASLVGYASTSNFYKAYRRSFGKSPREDLASAR